jgi:membrane protease YdiL (CAAX protease family)
MMAGLLEELLCRLAVLPLIYFAFQQRNHRTAGAIVAVIATGLVFAAWHALGEPTFSAQLFVTRFLIPGCVMSGIWLASPTALVAGHCVAHLLIPALF